MTQIVENLKFEEILPFFGVNGHVHFTEVTVPGPLEGINPPVRLIQTDQATNLKFHWNVFGPLSKLIAGNWKFSVFFEQMGQGEAPNDIQFEAGFQQGFNERIHVIPAHTVSAGVYRVVVTMTLSALDGTPAPVAAFAELGLIQFYDA